MFDADRFYMTPPIGNMGIKMFGRKQPFRIHSCTNNVDDTATALHSGQNCKPDQTSTHYQVTSQNSVSTLPIAEVIPFC
jgi:hypothetical protein